MSETPFPPTGPTTLTKTIPAYVYQQYADDDNIQALNSAYNTSTQQYVTWFATAMLPIYPGLAGQLLDWIATNLYGQPRPVLPAGSSYIIGAVGTFGANILPPNTTKLVGTPVFYSVDDDVYKRILTWNFYKGDGRTFSIPWLKRRIMRFLTGTSGTAPAIDQTYRISVTFGVGNQANIRLLNGLTTVYAGTIPNRVKCNQRPPNQIVTAFTPYTPLVNASTFVAALNGGALQLPFQFDWTVTIENGPNTAAFTDVGGVLYVTSAAGYPTSATGLPAGNVWMDGAGIVHVVPGITPNPSAPPLYFPGVTPAELLAIGGGNLPLTAGTTGAGQIWNNSGVVNVS